MTDGPWLIRVRLRRDASAAALAPLLVPDAAEARVNAGHRLIWSLLTDGDARDRDFLWRETGRGHWLALAARKPHGDLGLFEVESKPFAPVLHAGRRLAFSLKVNPVRAAAPAAKGARGKRVDVVTQALRGVAADARGAARDAAVRAWLDRQGTRNGFALDPSPPVIEAEEWMTLPRPGGPPMQFCALTVAGVLTVADPAAFLARIRQGFGAARAFGCGLMLIRPAHVGGADAETDAEEDDLA